MIDDTLGWMGHRGPQPLPRFFRGRIDRRHKWTVFYPPVHPIQLCMVVGRVGRFELPVVREQFPRAVLTRIPQHGAVLCPLGMLDPSICSLSVGRHCRYPR